MLKYTVTKWMDTEFYTEGPVVDAMERIYVTTLKGGEILHLHAPGDHSRWASGQTPNGQVVSNQGEHWVCESLHCGISRYDAQGRFSGYIVKDTCAGKRVNCPNDLILDRSGNLYFTDSVRSEGTVFFKGNDGVETVVAEGIDYANGLVLSANESVLYVAESYQNRILAIAIDSPGQGTNQRLWADLPAHPSGEAVRNLPDGLALDREGRLWVAHYGMQAVQVISAAGVWLGSLDTGLPLTSNIAFLKEEGNCKTIVVTGGYDEPGPGAVVVLTVWLDP